MLFINLKTYELGTGEKALEFVKTVEELKKDIDVPITILAQAVDIRMLANQTTIPIWAQHIDNIIYGKNTGWTLPAAIIDAGAQGTMINHAEHKLPISDVSEIINNYIKVKFQVMVSATAPEEIRFLDQFKPEYIAYEPQEYIGTKISVVDAAADIIETILSKINSKLVIGAGIHKPEHIIQGLDLGVKGFLISSDVLLSENPKQRIKEYMLAYKDAYNSLH